METDPLASLGIIGLKFGDEAKLDAFVSMLEPFGIKEIVRTGLTALKRGPEELKNIKQ